MDSVDFTGDLATLWTIDQVQSPCLFTILQHDGNESYDYDNVRYKAKNVRILSFPPLIVLMLICLRHKLMIYTDWKQ